MKRYIQTIITPPFLGIGSGVASPSYSATEMEVKLESAWYYEIDGKKIDSEQCCCFWGYSPYCPIHSKDPQALPLPKPQLETTPATE